jgi:hypothetical protein
MSATKGFHDVQETLEIKRHSLNVALQLKLGCKPEFTSG